MDERQDETSVCTEAAKSTGRVMIEGGGWVGVGAIME